MQQKLQKQLLHMRMANNQDACNKLNKLQKKAVVTKDINVFTCSIGQKATQAKYYVQDLNQIVPIVEQLINAAKKYKALEGPGVFKSNKGNKRLNSLANLASNFKGVKDIQNEVDDGKRQAKGGNFLQGYFKSRGNQASIGQRHRNHQSMLALRNFGNVNN